MATTTANYSLTKPAGTDTVDIGVINTNMDILDTEVASKAAQTTVTAHLAENASEIVKGHVELATAAEATAGTDNTRAVHPAGLKVELDKKIAHSLATAVSDFLVSSGAGVFVKKTLAEVKTILGLGTAAYTASTAYATAAQGTLATNAIPLSQKGAVGGVALYDDVTSHVADYVRQPGYAVTTGTANTYAVTLNPVPSGYVDGMCIAVKINITNTGASVINANGLGNKGIIDSKGAAMIAGKLTASGIYTLRLNGANFILQGEGGDYGTALAPQVLTGYTLGTTGGVIGGTMPNNSGTGYIVPANVATNGTGGLFVRISTGAYLVATGSGYVEVSPSDANFVAANLLSGKSYFGLAGSAPKITTSASAPSGGDDGDYWIQP